MRPTQHPARRYTSPLRERQAERTRELILDALTELLADRRADEVSTREIAQRAGVSQPTVYRHFPDRAALVEALADRVEHAVRESAVATPSTIDEWADWVGLAFAKSDEHATEAIAEAVLNADPRRYSDVSRQRSEAMRQSVARSLPDLDQRDQTRLAALLRVLASVQTWLRMREEFGLSGEDAGEIVSWAIRALAREADEGRFPGSPTQSPPL